MVVVVVVVVEEGKVSKGGVDVGTNGRTDGWMDGRRCSAERYSQVDR